MAEPYRVIVVEDDPDVANYCRTVLERGGCVVLTLADGREAVQAVADFDPDVIVTDIELPGISGLDLIAQVRDLRPTIPIIVTTAHASVDYAITALRNQADEFLTKPVTAAALLGHVNRLAEAARAAAASAPQPQVVLAIGAHPDDAEVGAGGVLAAHRAAGDPVWILTLSKGSRAGGIHTAWEECSASAAVIGATPLLEDVGDDPTEAIRKAIAEVEPTVIYVHSKNDHSQEHRAVHEATLLVASDVRTVACYQSSSSTVDFRPTRFIPIDAHTETKLSMLACFAIGAEPRPRHLKPDFALATSRAWSRYGSGDYCEPFEVVRDSAGVA